jgi:ribosomal protein L9
LRWWDKSGNLLLWGSELVEQEKQRAEQEKQRAEQEKQRAERLAAKLRSLGVEVDDSL